jgi:glycosyltransferase involved in cell wall biosynthesis
MEETVHDVRMILAANDPRFKHLNLELGKKVSKIASLDYDVIQILYKYIAAGLAFHSNKKVWWNRYQWHPIMQSARRHALLRQMLNKYSEFDVLLMVGSWFHPFRGTKLKIPFYVYIDQSCNKTADDHDMRSNALDKARIRFNKHQLETYQDCKAIFCMSDWARRQTLEAHDIPENKVYKVGWGPIGVNLVDEPITDTKGARDQYVLFVGHEFHRKGVDILRAAIPSVVEEVPNVRFKVVGGNSDRLHVEPHPNLDILGTIRDVEKMTELYRHATVFVLPHRFDRSPHVLVEAMSAGKPIITSDQGGAPEVIQHQKNGFVIKVGDSEALSHYIITLLRDRNMRLAFGEHSRKMMREGYTWEAIASKMLNIIAETEERRVGK